MQEHTAKNRGTRTKPPKKITVRYLRNAGLHYLKRYASSEGNFRRLMQKRITKSCAYHKDQLLEDCNKYLDEVIDNFKQEGFLNDNEYTKGMVYSLRKRGASKKMIHAKLKQKHLPYDKIEQEIKNIDQEIEEISEIPPELRAAYLHARKKRLGPYATHSNTDEQKIVNRAYGSFARAGFSYSIAKTVMLTPTEELPNL